MKKAEQDRNVDILDNTIKSEMLLNQKKELVIEHNEEHYRLRVTGNDKLILTK